MKYTIGLLGLCLSLLIKSDYSFKKKKKEKKRKEKLFLIVVCENNSGM